MNNADMPAMPITLEHGEVWSETQDHAHGLTKREYFAGLAMQGLLSDSNVRDAADNIARVSVGLSDALLAELERTL